MLNLGLNDESAAGLAARTGEERFAWDCYRRLVQMFGNVVRGIPGERFEDEIARVKRERGVTLDTELDADALRELTESFKSYYDFPTDPRQQLTEAIQAVFDSWMGERAVQYRRINRLPDDWGTAVNVQQMVYGNKGETSCSGVAFSRDEVTGAPTPSGDFLPRAQGEDVVSGVRTPLDLSELRDWMPEAADQLTEILRKLEAHYKDMQDTEFTVEEGRLFMLQTRSAKRPAQAARAVRGRRLRGAAADEGRGRRDDRRRSARRAPAPLVRHHGALHGARARGRGLAGRGEGRDRVHRAGRRRAGRRRKDRDPRAAVHRGRRRRRVPCRGRDPDLGGRQGLARGAGGTRHGPSGGHRCGRSGRRSQGSARCGSAMSSCTQATSSRSTAPTARSRPTTSRSSRPISTPGSRRSCAGPTSCARSAYGRTRTRPRTPPARTSFGAEGIGLCRTEHMFMAADRQPKMRAMIMAGDEAGRRAALDELLPLQQSDFEGLFEAMPGWPVTIRLLDPPLHEFLPDRFELHEEIVRARIDRSPASRWASRASSIGCGRSRRPTRCWARAACGWA